jgi:hypothetical protein
MLEETLSQAGSHRSGYTSDMSYIALLITLILLSPDASRLRPTRSQSSQSTTLDQSRSHQRITQTETIGHRIDLKSLPGARLFTTPNINPNKPVPLLIHFHGAPWLIEAHIARHLPKAALITVQLGSGSSVYRRPFENPDLFRELLNEAGQALSIKRGWSSITLTGFSAGYGGVREILRRPEYFRLVKNVLLLDGMHASYSPEGKLLADGGTIQASDVHVFVDFAREAAAGRKRFVVTHSEIFPGAYASTTECADHILSRLSLKRRSKRTNGPTGMQQLSDVNVKDFHLRGYAGNTAPDHVDFLHSMPAWFSLLRIME